MNHTPLTQVLSNNQKEITAGVFAILVAIIAGMFATTTKETPAPAVNQYIYAPTYTTINVAAATPTPQVAPKHKAPQPRKRQRKQHPKPVAKPLLQPSCPCADSTKAGV